MTNSNHKYAFIKSVTLQGLTKYEYMRYRDRLDHTDPRYMPLHRPNEYRREERLLTKYANTMLWFTDEDIKDPYRRAWKSHVKRTGG